MTRASCRSAVNGALILCLSLSVQPTLAPAKEARTPAPPSQTAARQEEALIPVATEGGLIYMTQQAYDEYVKSMGHLPEMSKQYVFGRKIPLPKTDKAGHIHLSDPAPAALHKSDAPR